MIYSFPKQRRLLKRQEYKETLDRNIKVVTPYIVLLGKPSKAERSRLGLIVSRKVGIAVVRNRIKRLLRESFRSMANHTIPLDIVIIARKPAASVDIETLKESLKWATERLTGKIQPPNRLRGAVD